MQCCQDPVFVSSLLLNVFTGCVSVSGSRWRVECRAPVPPSESRLLLLPLFAGWQHPDRISRPSEPSRRRLLQAEVCGSQSILLAAAAFFCDTFRLPQFRHTVPLASTVGKRVKPIARLQSPGRCALTSSVENLQAKAAPLLFIAPQEHLPLQGSPTLPHRLALRSWKEVTTSGVTSEGEARPKQPAATWGSPPPSRRERTRLYRNRNPARRRTSTARAAVPASLCFKGVGGAS